MEVTINEEGWNAEVGSVRLGACIGQTPLAEKGVPYRFVKQVHGAQVLTDETFMDPSQKADGLTTRLPGLALVVRTADCVPVHFFDDEGQVGAAHAGWRGVRAGILKAISEHFDPARTQAVLGPAITVDHYEVDADLYEDWIREEPELESFLQAHQPDSSKRLFDLKGYVVHQLEALQFKEVTVVPVCTHASGLPSYRRDATKEPSLWNYIYTLPPQLM